MKNRSIKPKQKVFHAPKTATPLTHMSQEELIRQGFRKPYFIKPDFKKTPEERKALDKARRLSGKADYAGISGSPKGAFPQIEQNLIIHVKNNGNPNYKSTLSFKVKQKEVQYILRIFLAGEQVTKAYFAGKLIVNNTTD